jgi:hypothetical protein
MTRDVGTRGGLIDLRCDRDPLAHLVPGNPFRPTKVPRAWVPISSAGPGKPEPVPDLGRQVAGHLPAARDLLAALNERRRTREQFVNVITATARPPIDRALVEQVLADMVRSELLVCRNTVYESASRGADFIESTSIYSNMPPAPVSITLVDADCGQVVATVAGLSPDLRGVRIAGRSFDILPGEEGFVRKVRGGGAHSEAPRYHARCFPGALLLRGVGPAQILPLLRRALDALARANPLGSQRVEQTADLGAHFDEMSADGKRRAREDWLDLPFLQRWLDSVQGVDLVQPDTPLAADLLTLADL